MPRKTLAALLAGLSLAMPAAHGAESTPAISLPTVDVSAEASRSAPNDLVRAQVYAEASDANPAEVARRVNATINQALQTSRAYPAVKVRTSGNNTWPIYAKNSRSIESWRMRSTLALESSDATAVSELLGKLQQTLAVGSLNVTPSPDTWRKTEDEVIGDAISAFQNRARLVAASLNRKWRIKHMSVNTGGGRPQPMMAYARAAGMADAAPPAPIEAGDTQINVSVSGQIELLD